MRKSGAFSLSELQALREKQQGSHHLDYNQRTGRYEGLVSNKRLCVEGWKFTEETDRMQTIAPTYRIWGVATWVSHWQGRIGKERGVYFEEIEAHHEAEAKEEEEGQR